MTRVPAPELAGAAAGGAIGALVRYAISTHWPEPRQVLIATLVTTAVAMAVIGFVVVGRLPSAVLALILTACGTVASLSAVAVIAVGQTPWLALAFLALTPVAALTGLTIGLVARSWLRT